MARIFPLNGTDPAQPGDAAPTREDAAAESAFLSRMSHELRTPLNAIIGFAEMSERQAFGALAEPYLGYASAIRNAAEHLLHVVNDILDLSGAEADRSALAMQPLPLSDIVAEAREIIAERAAERGVDISAVAADSRWWVAADADRLRRICVNLLDNAIKFTPPGGRAGINAGSTPANGHAAMATVTFWDTGPGVAPDCAGSIFDGLVAAGTDPMTAPADGGAGLGLAVARHLARQMGGDIVLEPDCPKGARFTLSLPLATGAAAAE